VKDNLLKPVSIYVHYPFCLSKCPYCDFNSHVKEKIDNLRFLRGYEAELEFFYEKIGKKQVKTVFFGGGTPSLMPIFLVEGILKKISDLFEVDENIEVTLEANPTSFESAKFKDLKKVGINRISLGIQSLHDKDLKFLGREHSSKEAILAINEASRIFDNFSFDLIYARPKQSLKEWESELKTAISFGSSHLSLYQLTIEKGTQFFRDYQKQKFQMPEDKLAADFYELTNKITQENGFLNYEISNYAKKNKECKHNLAYWQGDDYIGIGAGAHSRCYVSDLDARQAIMMTHKPENWLKKVEEIGNVIQKQESLSKQEILEELLLTSLRTQEGLTAKILQKHFSDKLIFDFFAKEKLSKLQEQGLIEFDENFIKISSKYKSLTNQIITKILS